MVRRDIACAILSRDGALTTPRAVLQAPQTRSRHREASGRGLACGPPVPEKRPTREQYVCIHIYIYIYICSYIYIYI